MVSWITIVIIRNHAFNHVIQLTSLLIVQVIWKGIAFEVIQMPEKKENILCVGHMGGSVC